MDSFVVGRCRKKGSFRGAQERECAGLGELMQGRWLRMRRERWGEWGNGGITEDERWSRVKEGKTTTRKGKRGKSWRDLAFLVNLFLVWGISPTPASRGLDPNGLFTVESGDFCVLDDYFQWFRVLLYRFSFLAGREFPGCAPISLRVHTNTPWSTEVVRTNIINMECLVPMRSSVEYP